MLAREADRPAIPRTGDHREGLEMNFGRITAGPVLAGLAIAVTFTASLRSADALELDTGEWEFTTTSKNPMSPTPRIETRTECVTDGTRSASEFLAGMKDCKVSDVVDTDTTMSYKVACENGPMTLDGSADLKTDGKTVSGEMKMSMHMTTNTADQAMVMTIGWAGKRLGACKGE